MASETYPAIARWIGECGWVQLDDREVGGFVAQALDYEGLKVEGAAADTLAGAMTGLEERLTEWFKAESLE